MRLWRCRAWGVGATVHVARQVGGGCAGHSRAPPPPTHPAHTPPSLQGLDCLLPAACCRLPALLQAAAETLLDLGVQAVLVKLGADGSLLLPGRGQQPIRQAAIRAPQVVDTTGGARGGGGGTPQVGGGGGWGVGAGRS